MISVARSRYAALGQLPLYYLPPTDRYLFVTCLDLPAADGHVGQREQVTLLLDVLEQLLGRRGLGEQAEERANGVAASNFGVM